MVFAAAKFLPSLMAKHALAIVAAATALGLAITGVFDKGTNQLGGVGG